MSEQAPSRDPALEHLELEHAGLYDWRSMRPEHRERLHLTLHGRGREPGHDHATRWTR